MDRCPIGLRCAPRFREATRMARRARRARGAFLAAAGVAVRPSRAAVRHRDPAAPKPPRAMRWTLLAIVAALALVLSVVLGPAAVPLGELLRSEEHTSELQSRLHLVCRLLLEKKKQYRHTPH